MNDATKRWRLIGRLAGAGLLVATGAIHLDLYLTGYRTIPTIGVLFLLQVVAAFALAAAVIATGSRVVAGAGAIFALSTLGGYLLSVWVGLFGFKEIRTTAGIVAGVIEVAAFVVLGLLAVFPAASSADTRWARVPSVDQPGLVRALGWGVVALTLVAGALLGTAAASAGGSSSTSAGAQLKAARIDGALVLTNSKGLTLYWFVPDTPSTSRCYGTCAAYWPPVTGKPAAGPGVTGMIGTIRRTDGTLQATYDNHPLYTYIGDSAPGQARGNDINLNGGVWHEQTVG